MKQIVIIILIGLVTQNCSNENTEEIDENCGFDSISNLQTKNSIKFNCYFQNKLMTVEKKGDTTLLKNYYLTDANVYQKFEYVLLINEEVDYNSSMFVDIKEKDNVVYVTINSDLNIEGIEIITEKDTVRNSGNRITLKKDNKIDIKQLRAYANKIVNNDSISKITFITRYYYSYEEIINNRTLLDQYTKIRACKLLK